MACALLGAQLPAACTLPLSRSCQGQDDCLTGQCVSGVCEAKQNDSSPTIQPGDGGEADSSDALWPDGSQPLPFACPAWADWPMPSPPSLTGVPSDPQRNLPNPQSYDTSGAEIVIDKVTHLVWQKSITSEALDWSDAKAYCAGLDAGGRTDWRLPSRIELVSLLDVTLWSSGDIDLAAFPDSSMDTFWTCSSGPGNPLAGWVVSFVQGTTVLYQGDVHHRVRCVIGAPTATPPPARYDLGAPGQVGDLKTLLTWVIAIPDVATWDDASASCASLGVGWRLPTVTELQTLIDETEDKMGVDASTFPTPDRPDASYWTSSFLYGAPDTPYFVSIGAGNSSSIDPTTRQRFRCVAATTPAD